VPAPQYVNLEFPYRSPKQRLRRGIWLALACLGVAGVGAAMMVPLGPRKSDAAMAPADQVSHTETIPAVSPIGYAAVDPPTASDHGAQVAGKPSCLGQSRDGACVSFQLPKVRMVRVTKLPAAGAGQHGNSAKSGVAAASSATKVDKAIAEPKKAQRMAHRQSQRRNHQPSARGYTSRERGYRHQGLAGNFW
jgi:hypothetical protein